MIGDILYFRPMVIQYDLLEVLLNAGQEGKEGNLISVDDVKNNRITAGQLANIVSNPKIIYSNIINKYYDANKIPFMIVHDNKDINEREVAYFYPNDNYKVTQASMDCYVDTMMNYYMHIAIDELGEVVIPDYESYLEFTRGVDTKSYATNQPHIYDLHDGISFVNINYENQLFNSNHI